MDQLPITDTVKIPLREIQLSALRAGGPGGQHVNKVATGIELRFDIPASSLPAALKERLLTSDDQRLTRNGVLIVQATQSRSQERNRSQALSRLQAWLRERLVPEKPRKPTRPGRQAVERRLQSKKLRSHVKRNRAPVRND